MGLLSDLKSDAGTILRSQWTVREGRVVPDTPDLKLANDGIRLDATVLYADIDGSTTMVDASTPEFAAEVYKTYLLCAGHLIRSEQGVITAYDGDRIMAIFLGDSKNTNAVRCALKINASTITIINPAIKAQYPKSTFVLRQVVGVDSSRLLVARTGVRGSNDLVWVGPAANHAAKLSSISEQPHATFISEAVYNTMNKSVKFADTGQDMWEARNWNGRTIYRSGWYWNIPDA
jgi:class 3 adenylate cyclase